MEAGAIEEVAFALNTNHSIRDGIPSGFGAALGAVVQAAAITVITALTVMAVFRPSIMAAVRAVRRPDRRPGIMATVRAVRRPVRRPGIMAAVRAVQRPVQRPGIMAIVATVLSAALTSVQRARVVAEVAAVRRVRVVAVFRAALTSVQRASVVAKVAAVRRVRVVAKVSTRVVVSGEIAKEIAERAISTISTISTKSYRGTGQTLTALELGNQLIT